MLAILVALSTGCSKTAVVQAQEFEFEHPPVIVVVIDTLRADHLSCYGYEHETSPVLETFAEQAFLFESNTTQSNATYPAMTSIFTGLYLKTHRDALAVPATGAVHSSKTIASLAERLKTFGYYTMAAVSHPSWTADRGQADWKETLSKSSLMRGWDELSAISAEIPIAERPLWAHAAYTNERAFALLDSYAEQAGDQPPCLWVHYFDPHTDVAGLSYCPPEGFRNRFLRQHLTVAGEEQLFEELGAVHPAQRLSFLRKLCGDDHKRLRRLRMANGRASYDAEIAFTDYSLENLFAKLRSMDLYDQAFIAVLADHGENMGRVNSEERAAFTHKGMHDGVLHTPLLIKLPGQKKGLRIEALTQNIDLVPTILETFELPEVPPVEGQSLLGLMEGEETLVHQQVFSESSNQPERMVRGDKLTLLRHELNEVRWEAYRWREDTFGRRDVLDEAQPAVVERLREELEQFSPQDAVRLRIEPRAEPFELNFSLLVTPAGIADVVGSAGAEIEWTPTSVDGQVRVEDEAVELVVLLNRRNVEQQWQLQADLMASTNLADSVFLGPLALTDTPAPQLYTRGPGQAPESPWLDLSSRAHGGLAHLHLSPSKASSLSIELRPFAGPVDIRKPLIGESGLQEARTHLRGGMVVRPEEETAVRLDLAKLGKGVAAVVRMDGKQLPRERIRLDGGPVAADQVGFLIGTPLDGRLIACMTAAPDQDSLPPGALVFTFDSIGGGAELDTEGLDPAVLEQLRALGYAK